MLNRVPLSLTTSEEQPATFQTLDAYTARRTQHSEEQMNALGRFPFGAPLAECGAQIPTRADAFILGAYPSALHVLWRAPIDSEFGRIHALAVDNEPTVFWDGSEADMYVKAWAHRFFDAAWGSVTPATLNGPSGSWVRGKITKPLEEARIGNWFITDCLTTYRNSAGGKAAIEARYNRFAADHPPLQPADLSDHPTENQIVDEALATQRDRLSQQIAAAGPQILVTLGNAAARVINHLASQPDSGKLRLEGYGTPRSIAVCGRRLTWFPLAHPAAPAPYQAQHDSWLDNGGFTAR